MIIGEKDSEQSEKRLRVVVDVAGLAIGSRTGPQAWRSVCTVDLSATTAMQIRPGQDHTQNRYHIAALGIPWLLLEAMATLLGGCTQIGTSSLRTFGDKNSGSFRSRSRTTVLY